MLLNHLIRFLVRKAVLRLDNTGSQRQPQRLCHIALRLRTGTRVIVSIGEETNILRYDDVVISEYAIPAMQGKVEIAGVNTSKLKILKNEETMELLRRVKTGDREARETLIEGNLRLVLSVIQKFSSRGENVDDLFQVGCVGLIKAIDNFDINQPVRFSTYGVPMG